MKKYKIIIDIINHFLALWLSYCIYIRAIFSIILSKSRFYSKIVIDKIKKDITPQNMIKMGFKKDITSFL